VSELLALGSALAFGSGDFLAGTAGRAAAPIKVTAVMHVVSLALTPLVILALGQASPTTADMLWGAAGGLFGLVGGFSLVTALAAGPMSVVAPTTGVLSAAIPVGYALVAGEQPGTVTLIGVVIGLVAIAVVSGADGPSGRLSGAVLGASLTAGIGFGLFFIFFAQTSEEAGMWPVLAARLVSVPVVLMAAWRMGGTNPRGESAKAAVGGGVLDTAGNVFYLAAAQRGLLTVAATLSALYPAVTAVLARFALHERMSPLQRSGVVMALVAVALIGWPA
jgi:drug/metabolite transporter (DMT)-like permease